LIGIFGCIGELGPLNSGELGATTAVDGGDAATGADESDSSGESNTSGGDETLTGGDSVVPEGDDLLVVSGTVSERYPNDAWDLSDPALVLVSNFESGTTDLTFSSYTGDPATIINNPGAAHTGNRSLKMSFTLTGLQSRGDASVHANALFTSSNGIYYVRYYMRYQTGTARPHHANGTRMYAPGFDAGGTAGIQPNGDERFNTTVDSDDQGRHYFYTYWHEMRSGRCLDGSATPGCAGDQGTTYYYGNVFKPAEQTIIDRYQWNCYEYRVQANTPNQYDGEQSLWINDALVGEFKTGAPLGAWLRDNFYTMGEYGTGSRQVPFEGYNFRTSSAVDHVRVTFQFYQEWNTLNNKRNDTPNKTEEQAVYYDDIVIATERIGCRTDQ
jgi:hypothetical protein